MIKETLHCDLCFRRIRRPLSVDAVPRVSIIVDDLQVEHDGIVLPDSSAMCLHCHETTLILVASFIKTTKTPKRVDNQSDDGV